MIWRGREKATIAAEAAAEVLKLRGQQVEKKLMGVNRKVGGSMASRNHATCFGPSR